LTKNDEEDAAKKKEGGEDGDGEGLDEATQEAEIEKAHWWKTKSDIG
jgi:hypothetical protein